MTPHDADDHDVADAKVAGSRHRRHDHREGTGGVLAGWRGAVVVTGTDTGVGKTMVTAAIAAVATAGGARVAMLKPAQTGDDDDAGTVARLAEPVTAKTLVSYPDPLAPLAAARVAGLPPLTLEAVLGEARRLSAEHDLVLIEGAGGLLVQLGASAGGEPWTVADLAVALRAPLVVVARAGLGTLNHTALTMEALRARGLAGSVVIGAWPRHPELVHHTNLTDLATIAELIGRVPERAADLPPTEFRRSAASWFQDHRTLPGTSPVSSA